MRITDILAGLSPEYATSVEEKQIAEQQAQQAAFVVVQRRQEAQQAVETAKGQADASIIAAEGAAKARLIEAQAEADALKLIEEALANNPELLTYQLFPSWLPTLVPCFYQATRPSYLPSQKAHHEIW